ncbi:unnamed protein product [Phaedon cochleariae]|uniref:XK-related protein n=1 Tax=Phaedon cochleariae TaxID=80249 RepID=A0A9N9SBT6_PHACE|nr:unnamed protein product [Phaedon cochleariae]
MCDSDRDDIDRIPSKDRVTNWDIAGFIFSIISHIADVFFDCNVAYRYYIADQLHYFIITMGFIIIPAIINTAFSVRMYVLDHDNVNRSTTLTKRFTKRRLCCIVVLLFQLAPILRYFDALQYALKSKKAEKKKDVENQRKYYELMVKEDSDVALLRVLECFLEAAPQLILQLSIIFYTHGKDMQNNTFTLIHQFLSIGSSFVSMAWSMASYQRLLRVALKTKNNISWAGTIVQFMWHFLVTVTRIHCISAIAWKFPMETGMVLICHWFMMIIWLASASSVFLLSRILCISAIAWKFPMETVMVLICHWFVMTIWLASTSAKNNFCDHNSLYDFLFYCILGAVYIFTHVILVEGPTCCKYLIFYSVLFAENTVANIVWSVTADDALRKMVYY